MDNTDLKNIFKNNLNAVKTVLKKSSAEMAEEMNVSVHTLNSYIKGERTVSLEMAAHLHQTYNINLEWFVSNKGGMFNNLSEKKEINIQSEEELEQIMLRLLRKNGIIK